MSTMAITAADVNKLRQITGAGMMDCKQALNEANGDFDAAIDILRKKGVAKAGTKGAVKFEHARKLGITIFSSTCWSPPLMPLSLIHI